MAEDETLLVAGLGMHVEIELIDTQGQAESMVIDIVPAKAADLDRGLIAANTPLAKAIRGKGAGQVVPYGLGDIHSIRVVRVIASEVAAPADAAQRREAVLKKALWDAERTNAEMFAASFSGKWGDYSLDDAAEWDV